MLINNKRQRVLSSWRRREAAALLNAPNCISPYIIHALRRREAAQSARRFYEPL